MADPQLSSRSRSADVDQNNLTQNKRNNSAFPTVNADEKELLLISFNMHGYNQGYQTVRDLIFDRNPDLFMLQVHWLTVMATQQSRVL